jgi:hypothetical protein
VLAALLPVGGPARADVIVNNFGPGDSVAPADGWSWPGYTFGNPPGVDTVSHIDVAVGFTPARGFALSRVTCSVFSEPGFGWTPDPPPAGYPFLLSLVADRGGLPAGKTLESWAELAPVDRTAETAVSVVHPTLVAGRRYWLVARSPNPLGGGVQDPLGWSYAADPAGLPTAVREDSQVLFRSHHSPWTAGADWGPSSELAARVEGIPVREAPEPPAFPLLGLGLAIVTLRRLAGKSSCGRASRGPAGGRTPLTAGAVL